MTYTDLSNGVSFLRIVERRPGTRQEVKAVEAIKELCDCSKYSYDELCYRLKSSIEIGGKIGHLAKQMTEAAKALIVMARIGKQAADAGTGLRKFLAQNMAVRETRRKINLLHMEKKYNETDHYD